MEKVPASFEALKKGGFNHYLTVLCQGAASESTHFT